MPPTVFSKIIASEIPCHRVYEDDKVLAFLDVNPIARGHTLVIPKEAVESVDQLTDESAAAIGRALPRICRAVLAATGAKAYNILQNNGSLAHQAVFHVHFHIIPKYDQGAHAGGPWCGEGLGIHWPAKPLDKADGMTLAKQIADQL